MPEPIRLCEDLRIRHAQGGAAAARIAKMASHASYKGFQLTKNDGLGEVGPFFAPALLTAWAEELVKRFSHAAVIFGGHFHDVAIPLLLVKKDYLTKIDKWRAKYYGDVGAPASPPVPLHQEFILCDRWSCR